MAELSEAAPARKEAPRLGCAKCNYTGVLAGKLGGRWTYYPQLKCECRSALSNREGVR